MPNIFTHTGYQLSEEDRLTNALTCLLEQADPEVLRAFLELAGMDEEQALENTLARVKLQPSFSQSRPDATLHLSRADIVIETKRGEMLDEEQFRAHWRHLRDEAERPTVLLGLTARQVSPALVRELEALSPPHLRVAYVSWSDWLASVRSLGARFEKSSATGFLLSQFEGYLESLGYWCFQGDVIEQVLDYAHILQRGFLHEAHTRGYLEQRFTRLAELLNERLETERSWEVRWWGSSGNFGRERTGIIRLETVFQDFGPNTQFRVSLDFGPAQRLRFHYYLTFVHTVPGFEALGDWLLDSREAFSDHEPFELFGYWANRKGFHIKKTVAHDDLFAFLRGEELEMRALVDGITTLLGLIDDALDGYTPP